MEQDQTLELFNEDKTCKIRCYIDTNNTYMFSVFDFINFINNKDLSDKYGKNTYHAVFDYEERKQHVKHTFKVIKSARDTPVMNLFDLIKLLFKLPGNFAKKFQEFSANTICLVLAGDKSLYDIIDKNQQNTGFLNQLCRFSVKTFTDFGIDDLNKQINNLNMELDISQKQSDILLQQNFKLYQSLNVKTEDFDICYDEWYKNMVKNIDLSENFATPTKLIKLSEYIVILRKDTFNFNYNPRDKGELESRSDFIKSEYKHYIIRGQKQYVDRKIDKIVDKYDLINHKIIINIKNPNPITFYLKLQEQTDILVDTKNNHLRVIDETKLICFIKEFQKNI
jgi:hypothetical protein